MDKPLNRLSLLRHASKPESAATTAALSQALELPRTPPRGQGIPLKVQSSLPWCPLVPWPTLIGRKHHMQKLQVRRRSPVLLQDLRLLEALQVVELPLPRVQVLPSQQVCCRKICHCSRHRKSQSCHCQGYKCSHCNKYPQF